MTTGTGEARRSVCRCGAPILRQLVGRSAALTVTADGLPLSLAQALAAAGPSRLPWCLADGQWSGPRLRWIARSTHPQDCPHPHLVDHHCNGLPPPPPALKQADLFNQ